MRIWWLVLLLVASVSDVLAQPAVPTDPPLRAEASKGVDPSDDVLRRAAAYVAQFEQTFAAVIWREDYQQENRVRRRFNSSGGSFYATTQRRQLESELLFVWLPADATWIAVRDVIAVDGKPRPAADRRLPEVLSSSAPSIGQLRQLARENGRFNIGRIVRTFNEPTLALLFLSDQYRQRFTFTQRREELVNGRPAATYDYAEHARPTVIQSQDRDVLARGTLWIDPESGRVLQTSLDISIPSGGVRGHMMVVYRPDAKFDVLVPSEMRETYRSVLGDEVTTVATYSNFRRFETAARIVPHE